jgi:hypothetical protein
MMVGYAFHVSNFHTLLSTGFHRRFPYVPKFPSSVFCSFLKYSAGTDGKSAISFSTQKNLFGLFG